MPRGERKDSDGLTTAIRLASVIGARLVRVDEDLASTWLIFEAPDGVRYSVAVMADEQGPWPGYLERALVLDAALERQLMERVGPAYRDVDHAIRAAVAAAQISHMTQLVIERADGAGLALVAADEDAVATWRASLDRGLLAIVTPFPLGLDDAGWGVDVERRDR